MPNQTPLPDWLFQYLQAPYEARQAGQMAPVQPPATLPNLTQVPFVGPGLGAIGFNGMPTAYTAQQFRPPAVPAVPVSPRPVPQMPAQQASNMQSGMAQQIPVRPAVTSGDWGGYAGYPTPMDAPALANEIGVPAMPGNGVGYGYAEKGATTRLAPGQPPAIAGMTPAAVAAIDGASRRWPTHSPLMWENPQVAAGAPLGMTPDEKRLAQGDVWAGRRSPSENAAMRAAPAVPQVPTMSPLARLAAMFGGGLPSLSKGPPQTSPFTQTASGGSLNGAHEDNMSAADYLAAAKKGGATADQLANIRRMYGI